MQDGEIEALVANAERLIGMASQPANAADAAQLNVRAQTTLLAALLREISALRSDLRHEFKALRDAQGS